MAASVIILLSLPFHREIRNQKHPYSCKTTFFIESRSWWRQKRSKQLHHMIYVGPGGGLNLKDGVDASGRKIKGKGLYQFAEKYGANVDGYSPIYTPEVWSPSGDVYMGGKTGLLIWAITLGGLLLGGALLVYNTSAFNLHFYVVYYYSFSNSKAKNM